MCTLCDRMKDAEEAYSNNFEDVSAIPSQFSPLVIEQNLQELKMIRDEMVDLQEKYKYSDETMQLIIEFTAKRLREKVKSGEMDNSHFSTYEKFQVYNQEMRMVAESLNT